MTKEELRLKEAREQTGHWKRWRPYLSERSGPTSAIPSASAWWSDRSLTAWIRWSPERHRMSGR